MSDRIRALELLVSLQSTGSFTATALAFRLSSTSVSRSIAMLEDRVGQSLLIRSTRNVRLTEAGVEYARRAVDILSSLEDLDQSMSVLRSVPAGLLRIHSRSMFGIGVLTPLLPAFADAYPEITVELILGEEPADLRRERIDIDFRLSEPDEPGIKRRKIYSSERWLVASPEYVARKGQPQSIADLANHHCMAYFSTTTTSQWWVTHPDGRKERVPFQPRFVSNHGAVMLELARRGGGAAVLDDYLVRKDIEQGSLLRLLPEISISSSARPGGLYFAILDSLETPAKIRVFLDFLTARLAGGGKRFQVENSWERTKS